MGWNNKRGKNKDSYQFIVFLGRDKEGKKIEKRKTIKLSNITNVKKRDLEAQRLFSIWESEVKGGNYVKTEKINLRDFSEKWLENYAKGNLKPKTLLEYTKLLKRINYVLGDIKLVNINPEMLYKFYQNLREVGVRMDKKYLPNQNFLDIITKLGFTYRDIKKLTNIADSVITSLKQGKSIQFSTASRIATALNVKINMLFAEVEQTKGLSEKTILHYHRLIGTILNTAVQWGYLTSNPVDKTSAPKVPKKKPKFFTLAETVNILNLLQSQPIKYRLMTTLAIFTGAREGEIAALNWGDIDTDSGAVIIDESLQHIAGNETATKTTKTDTIRTVGVPISVINLIKEYKDWQDIEKENLGDLWFKSDYLFTTQNGHHIFPSTISKWFLKFLRDYNKRIIDDTSIAEDEKDKYMLPEYNFHSLRHTNATLLNHLGIALARISKELGHTKLSTTADVYTHFMSGLDIDLINKLEQALLNKE